MAVRVTLSKDNVLEFHCETSQDNDVAGYLCKLVKDARTLVKSADPGTVAKSGLAGIALVRKAQEDKLALLKDLAAKYEQKAMDTSLTYEVRELASRKEFAAKEEMRRISSEGR